MASNRIGFNRFLKTVEDNQRVDVVIDSNILIAYFDEVHSDHDLVMGFVNKLDQKADVNFYTTVTTKSEFLDYNRKRFITSGLVGLVQELSEKLKISVKSKTKIQNTLTLRDNRIRRENKKFERSSEFDSNVNYFTDKEIKDIKREFRARDVQGEAGWIKICETFINQKLLKLENRLDEFCIYLTTRDGFQRENIFVVEEVDWKKTTEISSKTAMGYSDAMVLNMALATNIKYLATLDFDVVYAGAVSAPDKVILLPDNKIKDYKTILKRIS